MTDILDVQKNLLIIKIIKCKKAIACIRLVVFSRDRFDAIVNDALQEYEDIFWDTSILVWDTSILVS